MSPPRICLCVCTLFSICLGVDAYAAPYPPKPGEPHPQIVLPGIDGDRVVALSSLRGKKVLLVHFASW